MCNELDDFVEHDDDKDYDNLVENDDDNVCVHCLLLLHDVYVAFDDYLAL